jgi:menaquinol-cytochrome c reductase iron-sulfur subunit
MTNPEPTPTPASAPGAPADATASLTAFGSGGAAAATPEPDSCAATPATPEELNRRRFLQRLTLTLVGVGGAVVAVPMIGFIVAPLFVKDPRAWRTVGKVGDFKIGETTAVQFLDASPMPWAGVTARTAAWLRRTTAEEFVAFAVTCSHLGCPVRWEQSARLFLCPCHGGVYYEDGTVAAGPPPAPLAHYPVRIWEGAVQIQTMPIVIQGA